VVESVSTPPIPQTKRRRLHHWRWTGDAIAAIRARALSLTASATLVCILGAGGFLRFWHINVLGFNSDEAVYSGQAAALSGDSTLSQFFPIFRAHPMVFQYILSIAYSILGVHDLIGRSLAAVVGLATILLVYRIGADLYGRWVGIIAAALLALMPYHVVVTRQVLLDGPLTFCTTLTLLMLVRYAVTGRPIYMMAVGSALGLTFLTKETGFVMAAAAFAFLALSPQIRIRFWTLVASGFCMLVPMVMFPVSLSLAGRSDTARSYLVWQLLRPPNHTWDFFPTVVPPAIGWLVLLAAITGLWTLRRQRTWRETVLLCWIVMPTIVFQIWPVKGFQYLLPIAPAVAILAARTLILWRPRWRGSGWSTFPWINVIATLVIALTLAVPSWNSAAHQQTTTRTAGMGGIPGVRETGDWIDANTPEDAVFVAIGPSMANLVQYYGHRHAYGMSVSSNPLNRNPSYQPLLNPDAQIRYGNVQYLVYDSFTASRSTFFTNSLMRYVEKYNAREVYAYTVPNGVAADGSIVQEKIIVIYEVTPK
jgi:4-amino-4-deoxy-L-arabinose transferase-like glycosyltransferase